MRGMWWKAALVALLVLPPVSYVAGTLYAPLEVPDHRPALVLDDGPPPSAPVEPRVTLEPRPRPQPPRPPAPADDDGSDDVVDDGSDSDDSGVTIVRPVPQAAGGDDDDGDDDDRDDGDDDGDDDRDDERGDD